MDDREKSWLHIEDYFTQNNIPYIRQRLKSGDYTFKAVNEKIDYNFTKDIVVERKNSVSELASCFGQSRTRFESEFQRLKDNNTEVFMVIENDKYDDIIYGNYRSNIVPNSVEASLLSWMMRYDIKVVFCNKRNSGHVIHNILKYYLREFIKNTEKSNDNDKK